MNDLKKCVAVDFGGTKMIIGTVDSFGTIHNQKIYPTCTRNQEQAYECVLAGLEDYISSEGGKDADYCGIGMGLVGTIDYASGDWIELYGEEGDRRIPITRVLSERYHKPCFADNDVKCAINAELAFGAGKRARDFIYINIGTGIAGGFISDGKLIRGKANNAGEIGHIIVKWDSDVQCTCGQFGCVEAYASGIGMRLCSEQFKGRFPDSEFAQCVARGDYSTALLFEAAQKEDPLAKKVVEDAANALGVLVNNMACTFDPECIILGGGILSDPFMRQTVMGKIPANALAACRIGITELDNRTIGLVGASAYFFSRLDEKK